MAGVWWWLSIEQRLCPAPNSKLSGTDKSQEKRGQVEGKDREGRRKAKELTVIVLARSDLCHENQSGGDERVHFPCRYIRMFVFQLCNDDAVQTAGPSRVLCSGECWPLCFLWSQGACIHRRFDPLTFHYKQCETVCCMINLITITIAVWPCAMTCTFLIFQNDLSLSIIIATGNIVCRDYAVSPNRAAPVWTNSDKLHVLGNSSQCLIKSMFIRPTGVF